MVMTKTMSQDTIYSALYAALALTDSILQIWLTLTFAVIVATYIAGKRFDRRTHSISLWSIDASLVGSIRQVRQRRVSGILL